jgi:hypothetical protein
MLATIQLDGITIATRRDTHVYISHRPRIKRGFSSQAGAWMIRHSVTSLSWLGGEPRVVGLEWPEMPVQYVSSWSRAYRRMLQQAVCLFEGLPSRHELLSERIVVIERCRRYSFCGEEIDIMNTVCINLRTLCTHCPRKWLPSCYRLYTWSRCNGFTVISLCRHQHALPSPGCCQGQQECVSRPVNEFSVVCGFVETKFIYIAP